MPDMYANIKHLAVLKQCTSEIESDNFEDRVYGSCTLDYGVLNVCNFRRPDVVATCVYCCMYI
jgi:hypothetical protein